MSYCKTEYQSSVQAGSVQTGTAIVLRTGAHRWLVQGALLMAPLWIGSFSTGCGSACDEPDADPAVCGVATASPEPSVGPCADNEFLNAVPTTWALQRHLDQEVFVYGSPGTVEGWYPQYTDSYFLVTMTKNSDGSFSFYEDMCGVAISNIEIVEPSGDTTTQSTGFPKDPGDWAPSATWTASFSTNTESSGECSLSFGLASELASKEVYSIWGANLPDPLTSSCPESSSSSAWTDTDGDGEDGFTTTSYVDGTEFVNTYICQRLLLTHNAAPVSTTDSGKYAIKGDYSSIINDQSLAGDDSIVFPNSDPEVQFEAEQYANSYYYLEEMASGATCADVKTLFGF